jgi:hypothetical protein
VRPARHRLHRELREIVEDADETLAALDVIADRFIPSTRALVRLAVYSESHRRLRHVVDRLNEAKPERPWAVGPDPWLVRDEPG